MIGAVLGTVVLLVFVFALISPLESLRWWSRQEQIQSRPLLRLAEQDTPNPPRHSRFVIYLSGIGVVDGTRNAGSETRSMAELRRRLPHVCIIDDVFPYAPENQGLLQRTTARVWDRLDKARRKRRVPVLHYLINFRNFMQMLVSADHRYGPTYNLGVARGILDAIARQGWDPKQPVPVTLIGYSGGAQIAVGAAWYLSSIGIRVNVIGIGGVFADDPGLDHVERLWQLTGTRDRLWRLGGWLFPGRWRTAPLSTWARMLRQDRYEHHVIGPMTHDGAHSYFDFSARAPDGQTHQQITTNALEGLLRAMD